MFPEEFGEARDEAVEAAETAEKSEHGITAESAVINKNQERFNQCKKAFIRFQCATGEETIGFVSLVGRLCIKAIRHIPTRFIDRIKKTVHSFVAFFRRRYDRAVGRVLKFRTMLVRGVHRFGERVREGFGKNLFAGLGSVFYCLFRSVQFFCRYLATLFNYTVPVAGLCLLLAVVNHYMGLTFGLAVEYEGKTIGYVSNENVVFSAQQMMQERIVYGDGEEHITVDPTFTITVVDQNKLADANDVCNEMIAISGGVIEEAWGLYINDEFMGATVEGQALTDTLDTLLADYQKKYGFETVSFVDTVEIKEGLYPINGVVELSKLTDLVTSDVASQITYTVQLGDAPYNVAKEFGITLEELYANNPGMDNGNRFIPGDVLMIAGAKPYLSIQGTRTETFKESVSFSVEKTNTSSLYQGQTQIKKAGKNGENEVTYIVTYIDETVQSKQAIATKVIKKPVTQILLVGTKKVPNSVSSIKPSSGNGKIGNLTFMWPVDGGYYSRGWKYYHKAMDIAAPMNTPLRASADGIVVSAFTSGWNTGYGRYVKIDHGNGVCTLYAHCNTLKVKVGQKVKKGDLIALMGSTGNSTGSHVHFEIQVNGNRIDPEPYIGRYYNR